MSSVSALEVITALQLLSQTALTGQKIQELMSRADDLTEDEVIAILDKTDKTIDQLTNED